MIIIALSGKIGSGKDYLGKRIAGLYKTRDVTIMAFGDYLKCMCSIKDNIPIMSLYDRKTDEHRKLLQNRGTEERKKYPSGVSASQTSNEIFIKFLDCQTRIAEMRGVGAIVITDLRTKAEFEYLKTRGAFLIRVIAPERTKNKILAESKGDAEIYNSIANHESETELDSYGPFNLLIKNDPEDAYDVEKMFNLNLLRDIMDLQMGKKQPAN
jgi:hypothetical protein